MLFLNWITDLFVGTGVAHTIFMLALVIFGGLLLSRVRIGNVSLGVTWILFVGILAGQLGCTLDPTTAAFVKEFGLILFVFSLGMELGPGFFSSFRKGGVTLNLLAVIMVMLACLTTLVIHWATGENLLTLIGVMSGAVTNTPGMGAAQQTLLDTAGTQDSTYDTGLFKYCDRVGIPRFSMHVLRHTFATRCIEGGMKPKTLQKILGHSNIGITMNLYVHITEDEKHREIDLVADALKVV